MRIIEGEYVDLISPFPPQEIDRASQWFFQYSSYNGDDSSPKTPDNIKAVLLAMLESHVTYGIIDKTNLTKNSHEAPLVGIVGFAQHTPWNGYLQVASSRASWGKRNAASLTTEATKRVIEDIWETIPTLMRQSWLIPSKNYPIRKLAERCGASVDGVLQNFFRINDKPVDALHLGILKTTKGSIDDGMVINIR